MKKANGKPDVSTISQRLRHTSHAVETELAHLEAIIRGVLRSSVPDLSIGPHYWRARLRRLTSGYALLPIQQKRVDVLEKIVAEIETLSTGNSLRKRGRIAA